MPLEDYDRDAYEPIYGHNSHGAQKLIGVRRRDQEDIDRRRAAKAKTVAAISVDKSLRRPRSDRHTLDAE